MTYFVADWILFYSSIPSVQIIKRRHRKLGIKHRAASLLGPVRIPFLEKVMTMYTSLFDIFRLSLGPSSSHTGGPMLACNIFAHELKSRNILNKVGSIKVDLFGSLALTGHGHGTNKAITLGLMGFSPNKIIAKEAQSLREKAIKEGKLRVLQEKEIDFSENKNINYCYRKSLPFHSNAMQINANDKNEQLLLERRYYSIGGGFILSEDDITKKKEAKVEYPNLFKTGQQLLDLCQKKSVNIADIIIENESILNPSKKVYQQIDQLWQSMLESIKRGCSTHGTLPGKLKVKRRAKDLALKLQQDSHGSDDLKILDWVNLFAIAVNEENAAGAQIVVAPTNGAAGIFPAVGRYYQDFCETYDKDGLYRYFLAATAIANLYKNNASLSGAEVGCQGEVGVACSMAAGGLTAALGGNPMQIEQAAEIAMEHNLGLTCDPVGGLVQIPCIERNAMAAVKAINASRLALQGDGKHFVSLDAVIKTMMQTGEDMKTKYKETSRGGLAVNVTEC